MDTLELMKERHSVRKYKDEPIENDKRTIIDSLIEEINDKSELTIEAIYDEPKCFDSFMAHYGKFVNVKNYITIVGQSHLQVDAGYYGEEIVLKAQELGLNTCWVAMTHGKPKIKIEKGRKLLIIIAIGYGETQGVEHKSKPINKLCSFDADETWFKQGMEAVALAPTAMNQQQFHFTLKDNEVTAKSLGGFYSMIDLGIAKYHFEAVTGHKVQL